MSDEIEDGYGSREVTPEDRKVAVWRELINSEPVVRITPGMWEGLRRGRRRPWWRRWTARKGTTA